MGLPNHRAATSIVIKLKTTYQGFDVLEQRGVRRVTPLVFKHILGLEWSFLHAKSLLKKNCIRRM